MERTVDVATGESVAFTYELAGLGSRFFAVFIDIVIQFAVAASVLLLIAAVGSALPAGAPKPLAAAGKTGQAILTALATIAAFILFFGYFIVFEWRFGKTPGKAVVGIRVVRDGGFPLDVTSSVVRNVVRLLEFGAGFYAVSAISTLLSPLNRRLGDIAAGTIVVRDRRYERTASRERGEGIERDDPLVRELAPSERELVRRYAQRRAGLGNAARAALARQIACVVRPKLGVPFDHLDDDDLLVHLAATALAGS